MSSQDPKKNTLPDLPAYEQSESGLPPDDPSRRRFVIGAGSLALGAGLGLTGCGGGQGHSAEDRFGFGIASGDPLPDRVILWTRVNNVTGPAQVNWEVAGDPGFTQIVRSGTAVTDESRDYTVKVDVDGLQPGTAYVYRFRFGSEVSATGGTRTLPVGNTQKVRLAVFSCAAYSLGQFHAYHHAASRNDLDAALMLGDYIYETGLSDAEQALARVIGRAADPQGELHTLADYRQRYKRYHTDSDLRAVRSLMPVIAVWDDHELMNDIWRNGSRAEAPGSPSFLARRAAAIQAFHEWLPTRTGPDPMKIYRSFDFGNLLSLHMLDTRVIGRDAPVGRDEWLAGAGAVPARQLLGSEQEAALLQRLQASSATWQLLGQQVVMGPMQIPLSVFDNFSEDSINEFLQALDTSEAARTDRQRALIVQPRIGYELTNWDGFLAARERVLGAARSLDKNLVVVSGDSHNAWGHDLRDASGAHVGVEFATPSVTSTGLEISHPSITRQFLADSFKRMVPDLKFADTSRRGYLTVTFTPAAAVGEWVFVTSVLENDFSASVGGRLQTLPGAANRTLIPA